MLNMTFFGEMLTFILLIFFTMKYVWPPITKAIEERQKQISDGLIASERGKHDLDLAQHKAVQIIHDAKIEAQNLLEQAKLQSDKIVEHSKSQARIEGERLLQLAQADIEKEKISAQMQLQHQATTLALTIAEKFLRSQANNVNSKQLFEQLLGQVASEN